MRQVAFPAFERGMSHAGEGLASLRGPVADERLAFLVDALVDGGAQRAFGDLDPDRWLEASHRLLFSAWAPNADGTWRVEGEPPGFAGSFDQTLQLTMLLEDPSYPYARARDADQHRDDYLAALPRRGSLSAMVCGAWDPLPPFAPDQVLSAHGRGVYRPADGLAVAEWSYRCAGDVARMSARLPEQLKMLLTRERQRLSPLPLPEAQALLDHWLEGTPLPPLRVAFSGLGPLATDWAQDLGMLLALIRGAAQQGQGLSCLVTGVGRDAFEAIEL